MRFDVWGHHADGTVDIMVRNEEEKQVVLAFFANSKCEVVVEDVQAQLDEAERVRTNVSADADWFASYHTLAETVNWWKALPATYPAVKMTWIDQIAVTEGGNRLSALEMTVGATSNPWIYFQCQIHAREWISGATCQWIIDELLRQYTAGHQATRDIFARYNFAIVPVVNPDGFAFTWTNDRLWRKNRRTNSGSTCRGVDLNRNYNDHWGQGGSSTNPCSDTYMGPSVASEPEVRGIQAYVKGLLSKGPIWMGIDWHSYSQLILRPYGWTSANSPSETQLAAMGTGYRNAVLNTHTPGRSYTSQKSIDLYVTTGSAGDWLYGTDLVPNSSANKGFRVAAYTIELRPVNNPPGFELPPAEIHPTGKENYNGVLSFINYLTTNNGIKW